MFKKTIEFEDFNGNGKSKDFYFHMSKAELLSLAANGEEMIARFQRISDSKDMAGILREFRGIIKMACGVRSEDGERFIKTPEAQSELLDSPAYDVLLWELCTNTGAAVEFVQQLFPQKLLDDILEQAKKAPDPFVETDNRTHSSDDNRPAWQKEGRVPTQAELIGMSTAELQQAFRLSGK